MIELQSHFSQHLYMFKRNSRRKAGSIVVDPLALLRLSTPFLVLLSSVIGLIFYVALQGNRLLTDIDGFQPEVIYKLQLYVESMTTTLLWGQLIFGTLCLLLWVIFSHRIFGPVVPIRRQIKNLIDGNYNSKITLRKNDELKQVAEDLNKLAETLKNSRGQSLIQVMISLSIMGMLTVGMISIQRMQGRENKALTDKLAILDAQKLVTSTLADGSVCTFQVTSLADPTFLASDVTPTTFPPPKNLGPNLLSGAFATAPPILTVGNPISSISNAVIVSSIELRNIRCTGACVPATSNIFTADIQVNFDGSNLVRGVKPIVSQTTIQTTTAGGVKTITGCQGAVVTAPSDSIPPGAVVGFDLNSCPVGWSDYIPAYGRFLRGIDKAVTPIDPSGLRVPGNQQNQGTAKNGLGLNFATIMTYTSNSGWGYGVNNVSFYDYPVQIVSTDPETRPVNTAVLYCRKN